MRVHQISLWAHDLPLAVPYSYAEVTLTSVTSLILRLRTDTGLEGWGESCPLGATYAPAHAGGGIAAVEEFAPALIGREAMPRVLGAAMDAVLEGHAYAKALVDIAAWDVLGKVAGLRLCDLLGGALADPVPSYFAIAPLPPQQAAEQARAMVAEGYPAIQLKIGSGDLARDVASIRAVWDVLPTGTLLAADANRSLLLDEALWLSNQMAGVPLALEQPCATTEEMIGLRARCRHPVYWDESTTSTTAVLHALGAGQCDGLGMKVTRVGGVSGMIAVRDMAVAANARLSVDDSWGGDIIAATCAHIGATVPPRLFRGTWIAQPYIGAHIDPAGGINVSGGHIDLPKGPGLGVTPDVARLGPPIATYGGDA